MKNKIFSRSLAACLALVMMLSAMAVLPISANVGDPPARTENKPLSYMLADDGDLLYTIDFRGDQAFSSADYLEGSNGGNVFTDNKTFTPSADGSEVTVAGKGSSGSNFVWWGGEIEGLSLPQNGMISMIYKAKALDRNGATAGHNNSIAVGGLAPNPQNNADIYVNYSNHCSINADPTYTRDNRPLGDSLFRSRINRSQTAVGASAVNGVSLFGGYTYFDDLPAYPAKDADGYMTTLIEYDAKNGKINTYYLVSGTGTKKSDWQPIQTTDYTWSVTDVMGYWTFASYNIVNTSVKDVSYYKGTYYAEAEAPLIEIGTADALIALNETLASSAYAEADTVRIHLTDDIDMLGKSYTPVSTTKTVQFNGNMYTISNLSIGTEQAPVLNAGLFATAGAGSSFRNLLLEEVAIYGTEFTGAVIANPVYGDLTMVLVAVGGTVVDATTGTDTIPHIGFAGGLVGGNDYQSTTTTEVTWTLSHCVNRANVTAPVSAAGLVGAVCGAFNFDVDYCANTGSITVLGGGCKNSDNQAAGLLNLRHHGYADGVMVDGTFDNCFNIGSLTVLDINSQSNFAGTGGIVGLYRVYGGEGAIYTNTLAFYNCFDYSERSYPNHLSSRHGAIAIWVSRAEIPRVYYTNCYGAVVTGSPDGYNDLYGEMCKATVEKNCGIVASGDSKIALTTGTITLNEMIKNLAIAIVTLSEVEMPTFNIDDGKTRDYTWYYKNGALVEGKGTEDAPYEIASAAQFAALSALTWGQQDPEMVGGNASPVDFHQVCFQLTADIDLTGYCVAPLNMEDDSIIFDGSFHTIKNWKIEHATNGGMFAAVGVESIVKNLKLDNVDVEAFDTGAVLIATAKANLMVYNIEITDTCSVVAEGKIAGGIVGTILDNEATDEDVVMILYCVNEADVTAYSVVGGIVGETEGIFNYIYFCCANKGELLANGVGPYYVGGIFGHSARGLQGEGSYNNIVGFCYNVGKLSTLDTTAACYVGGIVGYLQGSTGTEVVFSACYDASARSVSTASSLNLKNGGIAGFADSQQVVKFVEMCYATNGAGTESVVTKLVTWTITSSSLIDSYSKLVSGLDVAIINVNELSSTMRADMAEIDEMIAEGYHVWDNGEITTPATHTTPGEITYTCLDCGATTTEPIEIAPHEYGDWVRVDDESHKKTCECGHVIIDTHTWNSGEIITPPTHTSKGIKCLTCTGCGVVKVVEIEKTDAHEYGEWEMLNGEKHQKECACGDTVTADHEWDDGEIMKEPSHSADGEKKFVCATCGATKTEPIAKSGDHAYGAWESADEKTHKRSCACGASESEYHAWDHGKSNAETGMMVYTCYGCGATDTVPLNTIFPDSNATTTATDGSEGCSSAMVSPWSVLVVVALLPLMFFRKKKENE